MKNIVVIGGRSGIGTRIVHGLISEGERVYIFGRNEPDLSSAFLKFSNFEVLHDEMDMSSIPSVVDGLVYLPGTISLKPLRAFKEKDFIDDFRINVTGAIKVIRSLYDNMRKSENASIVFFSTVAVQTGMPFHSMVSTSKGALEGLSRALAAEFAPNIRVNAIAPSLTNTGLAGDLLSGTEKIEASNKRHPLKRIGQPDDIARTALFLLSDHSSWITGQVIHVDGGMSSLKQF